MNSLPHSDCLLIHNLLKLIELFQLDTLSVFDFLEQLSLLLLHLLDATLMLIYLLLCGLSLSLEEALSCLTI